MRKVTPGGLLLTIPSLSIASDLLARSPQSRRALAAAWLLLACSCLGASIGIRIRDAGSVVNHYRWIAVACLAFSAVLVEHLVIGAGIILMLVRILTWTGGVLGVLLAAAALGRAQVKAAVAGPRDVR